MLQIPKALACRVNNLPEYSFQTVYQADLSPHSSTETQLSTLDHQLSMPRSFPPARREEDLPESFLGTETATISVWNSPSDYNYLSLPIAAVDSFATLTVNMLSLATQSPLAPDKSFYMQQIPKKKKIGVLLYFSISKQYNFSSYLSSLSR